VNVFFLSLHSRKLTGSAVSISIVVQCVLGLEAKTLEVGPTDEVSGRVQIYIAGNRKWKLL